MAILHSGSTPRHALLTGLFWLLRGGTSDATALQAERRVHLPSAPGRLLHFLHVSLHQLSRHLLTHAGELLCKQRDSFICTVLTDNNL